MCFCATYKHMRTTLDISDPILTQAKLRAVEDRTSLKSLVEDALRKYLFAKEATSYLSEPFQFPVLPGQGGMAEGIDPTKTSSLLSPDDDIPVLLREISPVEVSSLYLSLPKSNKMILLDVCVLVAAVRPDHPHHSLVIGKLNSYFLHNRPMAWNGHLLAGMVRILINPRAWNGASSSLEGALATAQKLTEYPGANHIAPGVSHWRLTQDLARAVNAKAEDISDAFHAALAIEHDCEFWTLDRDFSRYPGLRSLCLLDD